MFNLRFLPHAPFYLYSLSLPIELQSFPQSAYFYSILMEQFSVLFPCRLAARSKGLTGPRLTPFGNTMGDAVFFHEKTHDVYLIFTFFFMISAADEAQGLDPFIYQRLQIVIFYHFAFLLAGILTLIYYLASQLM